MASMTDSSDFCRIDSGSGSFAEDEAHRVQKNGFTGAGLARQDGQT
jgi:hypothetical protein